MEKVDRLKISIKNWEKKHKKSVWEKAKKKERRERELQELIEELTSWKNILEEEAYHWKNFDVIAITKNLEQEIDVILSANSCKLSQPDKKKLDEMRILINEAKERKREKKKGERYGNFPQ